MCRVCTCVELACIQGLHTCIVCMCAEFARLQGMHACRVRCACKQGVRVCVEEEAPQQDQTMGTGSWCLARAGAHPALLGVLLQWPQYEGLDVTHRAAAAHCFPTQNEPRSHAWSHVPISMQTPSTLLGVRLPLGAGRGHTCHQQHPDLPAEPEASSAPVLPQLCWRKAVTDVAA